MKTTKISILVLVFLMLSIMVFTASLRTVKASIPGDIDHDGDVDIDDVVAACMAYNSKTGDSNYNAEADLALPFGYIDIFDIVTVISHYGQHE